jgi:hypothetical protein
MENVGILDDHLEYFTVIWYNLSPFGIVCGHLVYFSKFGMFGPRKIWQPWEEVKTENIEGVSSWACAEGVQDEMSSRLLNTKQEIF